MEWIELIVHTTTEGSDAVSDLMMELGSGGTMVEDRADIPDPNQPHGYWEIIDPKLVDSMPEDVLVHAWFEPGPSFPETLNRLSLRLDEMRADHPEWGALTLDRRAVKDEDWNEVWKQYYKPFYAGRHIVIKPTWESFTPAEGDKIIQLDPGMAFGSGTHETTGMCVSLLEEVLEGGESVIDVGTGSGILAIAAALCGAREVLAIDIDPDAVRVARENTELNHLSDIIQVQQGDLLERVDAVCDVCVANIISDIIISFAAPLTKHIRPGGLFLCSGIVRQRGGEVRQSLEAAGYEVLREEHRGEWVAFLNRRPEA